MSATSGIGVSQDLAAQFSSAVDSRSTRFLKVSIRNESLVHDLSIPVEGSLTDDLQKLQDHEVLQDDVPAYVLAKLDEPSTEWLAIYYVPDSAKVRDKASLMLYASTRASLLKSLGSTVFTDSIFATSKADLTPEAYAAHLKHMAAPKPLSAREQEMEDIRAAERAASANGGMPTYEGSRARTSMVGAGIGLSWNSDVEDAVEELGKGESSALVVATIDTATETLVLSSSSTASVETLSSALPSSDPCYALFAWPHSYNGSSKREIIFIYSCPSTSPIKHRMVYSSGASGVFQAAKTLLSSSSSTFNSRKIETSDPSELDESFLKAELGLSAVPSGSTGNEGTKASDGTKSFARPRGPARRRP